MKKHKMWRQGDILLIQVEALPETATLEDGACILAYGEATGHSHQVHEHGQIFVDVTDKGQRYLQVIAATVLKHQEHGEIALKGPSIFKIIRQREYSPAEIRTVVD